MNIAAIPLTWGPFYLTRELRMQTIKLPAFEQPSHGLLSLWAEGMSEWLSAVNSQDCSDEITVFLAAVQTMVATGVLPPWPRLCPTKSAQSSPDPGLAEDGRPKQKRKLVELEGVSQSIDSLVQKGVILMDTDGSSKRTHHRKSRRCGGGGGGGWRFIFRQRSNARTSALQSR